MRHIRKFLTLLLAMVMVLSFGMTAFAAGSATITVNDALKDGTYTAYKIFGATKNADATSWAYTIESTNPFFTTVQTFAAVAANGLKLEQIDGTTTYNVTFDANFTDSKAKELSQNLYAAISASGTPIAATATATGATVSGATKAEFTGLDEGYYLITSPVGSAHILDTTGGTDIYEKNGLPSLTKQVKEDNPATGESEWRALNDAAYGTAVEFKIEIKVEKSADDYVLTDKLPNGFTLTAGSIKVQYAEKNTDGTYKTAVDIANASNANYELVTTGLSAGEVFQITFKASYLGGLKAGDKLVITYSAAVGTDVPVNTPNKNTAKLKYGREEKLHQEASTDTYIWDFGVYKFMKTAPDAATKTPLAGATFQLTKDGSSTPISFLKDADAETYRQVAAGTANAQTEITTSTTGTANATFRLQGLDSGTYYLTETKAPDGYNRLRGPIKVVITRTKETDALSSGVTCYNWKESVGNDTTKHYSDTADGTVTDKVLEVENKTGTELPSTGGVGTTLFYIVGGILMVCAGVLLIAKRRMRDEA